MSKSSSFARSRVILATVLAASLFSVGNLAQNAGIAGHTAIARAAAADSGDALYVGTPDSDIDVVAIPLDGYSCSDGGTVDLGTVQTDDNGYADEWADEILEGDSIDQVWGQPDYSTPVSGAGGYGVTISTNLFQLGFEGGPSGCQIVWYDFTSGMIQDGPRDAVLAQQQLSEANIPVEIEAKPLDASTFSGSDPTAGEGVTDDNGYVQASLDSGLDGYGSNPNFVTDDGYINLEILYQDPNGSSWDDSGVGLQYYISEEPGPFDQVIEQTQLSDGDGNGLTDTTVEVDAVPVDSTDPAGDPNDEVVGGGTDGLKWTSVRNPLDTVLRARKQHVRSPGPHQVRPLHRERGWLAGPSEDHKRVLPSRRSRGSDPGRHPGDQSRYRSGHVQYRSDGPGRAYQHGRLLRANRLSGGRHGRNRFQRPRRCDTRPLSGANRRLHDPQRRYDLRSVHGKLGRHRDLQFVLDRILRRHLRQGPTGGAANRTLIRVAGHQPAGPDQGATAQSR